MKPSTLGNNENGQQNNPARGNQAKLHNKKPINTAHQHKADNKLSNKESDNLATDLGSTREVYDCIFIRMSQSTESGPLTNAEDVCEDKSGNKGQDARDGSSGPNGAFAT